MNRLSIDRHYDLIIIGGFGHVGLPFGIALAAAGYQVGLYDLDGSKRDVIAAGKMPFMEVGAEPILRSVLGRSLHIVDSLGAVAGAPTVVITVGTPIDEHLNPRLASIRRLVEELGPFLRGGQCVIIRSTVYPGTLRYLNEVLKRAGHEVHLAYCPERIVQGYAIEELRALPQVISGFTPEALQGAQAIFSRLGVETVPVTPEEAELAKLFSNAWRYIQFAIVNQFYMIAADHGVNFPNVYHAMTHNYERTMNLPRPGFAAGPCLLKDTLQLAAFHGNHFQLGHAAMMINEGLPMFIVRHLRRQLGTLDGVAVGILGMAFKADSDDVRDSLSFKLAKILRFEGARVLCSDEYVRDPTFVSSEHISATCPVVIIGVPHRQYRQLEFPQGTHVVDLWQVVRSWAGAGVREGPAPVSSSGS